MVTATTEHPTATRARSRLPQWLLILSPLAYVVIIAVSIPLVLTLGPEMVVLEDLTRSQMDRFTAAWVTINILQLIPGVALVGIVLIGMRIAGRGRRWAIASVAVASLGLLALVSGVVLRIAAMGFDGARLAADPRYAVGTVIVASLTIPMLATVLLCIALWFSGALRISAVVIGAMASVFVVLDLLSYTSGLVLPPILAAIAIWLPLGVLLLRRRKLASETGS